MHPNANGGFQFTLCIGTKNLFCDAANSDEDAQFLFSQSFTDDYLHVYNDLFTSLVKTYLLRKKTLVRYLQMLYQKLNGFKQHRECHCFDSQLENDITM